MLLSSSSFSDVSPCERALWLVQRSARLREEKAGGLDSVHKVEAENNPWRCAIEHGER